MDTFVDSGTLRIETETGAGWTTFMDVPSPGGVEIEIPVGGMSALRLTAMSGTAALAGVCWSTETSLQAVAAYQAAWAEFETSLTRWADESPVFNPGSHYYIELTTEVRVVGDSSTTETYSTFIQFKTLGAPGDFASVEPTLAGHALDDLDLYVAQTLPSNDSGPHYRTYGLQVAFNQDHVGSMYAGQVFLEVRDVSGAVIETGGLAYYAAATPEQASTTATVTWRGVLDDSGCVSSTNAELVLGGGVTQYANPNLSLPASQRLSVRITGGGNTLHEFSCVTSRYNNLTEHLADRLNVVVDVDVPSSGAPSDATLDGWVSSYAAVADSTGSIALGRDLENEAQGFELVAAGLQLPDAPPAERLDISLVQSSARRYALYLRSTEPLMAERLEFQLSDVASGTSVPVSQWAMLWNSTRTEAFAFIPDGTRLAGDVPAGSYQLQAVLHADIAGVDDSALALVLPSGAPSETTTVPIEIM